MGRIEILIKLSVEPRDFHLDGFFIIIRSQVRMTKLCLLIFGNDLQTQALFQIGQGVPPPIPTYLSKDARSFISQCVRVDPSDRPSASELLDHPFVKGSIQSSQFADSPHHVIDRWNHL
jgi:serine/threonine protein kinase